MKGITHFITGMAIAGCLPGSMEAAAAGQPTCLLLGGIFGLLPDTLDFKFCRYFYRHDLTLVPEPLDPDPTPIARSLGAAIEQAQRHQRPVRVKLQTMRLGHDLWQRYRLDLDTAAQRLTVSIGPRVGTSGEPVSPTAPLAKGRQATVALACPLRLDYLATTDVDILDGPSFSFTPEGEVVAVSFLPWHRAWSHSFVVAALTGMVVAVVARSGAAGLATGCAIALHIGCDQLGFMGSNLTWPFGTRRIPGRRLAHSGAWFPNLLAIWLAALLLYHGMARVGPESAPPLAALLAWGWLAPGGAIWLLRRWSRRRLEIALAATLKHGNGPGNGRVER